MSLSGHRRSLASCVHSTGSMRLGLLSADSRSIPNPCYSYVHPPSRTSYGILHPYPLSRSPIEPKRTNRCANASFDRTCHQLLPQPLDWRIRDALQHLEQDVRSCVPYHFHQLRHVLAIGLIRPVQILTYVVSKIYHRNPSMSSSSNTQYDGLPVRRLHDVHE